MIIPIRYPIKTAGKLSLSGLKTKKGIILGITKTRVYTIHGTSSAGLHCKEKKKKFWNFYFAGCRLTTACGRKNTPIWEGHSFGWVTHTVVGAPRRTAVYLPISVYTMAWLEEHRAFIVEKFIKNDGSPVATQRAFRIRFALGRREAVPDKKTIYL